MTSTGPDVAPPDDGAGPDVAPPDDGAPPSPSRGKTLLKIALGLAVVAGLVYFGRQGAGQIDAFIAKVEGFGGWAPLVFVLGYAVATVGFIPGSALTLAAGAVFGIVEGTLYAFLGATLGATASFLIARYGARSWVEKKLAAYPRFRKIDAAVGQDGGKIVALLRLAPLFPFNLLNYALGLTSVRFVPYVVASLAMLPGTLMYVYFGKVGRDVATASGRTPMEWALLVVGLIAVVAATALITLKAKQALAETVRGGVMSEPSRAHNEETEPLVLPADEHNQRLVDHVHPADWTNPEPAGRYHLVVVGGGTAGLVSAAGAAGLGARVALVERALLGGDCLNYGCVPSKGVIRAARAWHEARTAAARFGGPAVVEEGSFPAVMERMRRLRADISHHDSARRFTDLGVDVFLGNARFVASDAIEVGGQRLRFRRAVIATGARAAAPPIPGLAEAGYRTNENFFALTELPRRLAVLGAGPIGCEMAQTFARFGSRVTLMDMAPQVLIREDPDAAAVVQEALVRDGVDLALGVKILRVEVAGGNRILHLEREGEAWTVEADELLVAAGRAPNVEGLGLEAAGVEYSRRGVVVDDRLRTTSSRIYAAGDVASQFQFTHTADAQARIVIQNALFFGRKKASDLTVPWCTYTSPEIAHVGLYEKDAREAGIPVDTLTLPLSQVDRAILDGGDEGFLRLHLKGGTDHILGATLVSEHAGDQLGELYLAATHGIGLGKIAAVIHPYPTQIEVIKKAADTWNRGKLTPFVRKVFTAWFKIFS